MPGYTRLATSAHGLSTALTSITIKGRVFWSLVFAAATVYETCQVVSMVIRYHHYDTTVEVSHHDNYVPFPAVTLCSLNNVKRSSLGMVPKLVALQKVFNETETKMLNDREQKTVEKQHNITKRSTNDSCYNETENCINTLDPTCFNADNYAGTKSTTQSGRTCQVWALNAPHAHKKYHHLSDNYCRNPNNDTWGANCFTTDPQQRWEYCFYGRNDCLSPTPCYSETANCINASVPACLNSFNYFGTKNTTRSNIACQSWASDTPHAHSFDNLPHNYCRNPTRKTGPWCYTTDPNLEWDYCFVDCETVVTTTTTTTTATTTTTTTTTTAYDICLTNPCFNGGTCNNGTGDWWCTCTSHYNSTTNCETLNNYCGNVPNPCVHGSCSLEDAAPFCTCERGWIGFHCDVATDECADLPCYPTATCHDLHLDFECSCVEGMTGILCDDDIDDCENSSCAANDTCVDYLNGYSCLSANIVVETEAEVKDLFEQNESIANEELQDLLEELKEELLADLKNFDDTDLALFRSFNDQHIAELAHSKNLNPEVVAGLKTFNDEHLSRLKNYDPEQLDELKNYADELYKSKTEVTVPEKTPQSVKDEIDVRFKDTLMQLDQATLAKTGFDLAEILSSCTFAAIKNCDWERFYHYQYGNCYTFNNNLTNQRHTVRAGMQHGLILTIRVSSDEYMYGVETQGVRLAIHEPGVVPFPDTSGFSVMAGYVNTYILSYKDQTTLGPPYSSCISSTDEVYSFYYRGGYSVEACELSYKQAKIREQCRCYNSILPKPNNTDVPFCNVTNKGCVDKIFNNASLIGTHCAQACRAVLYDVVSTKLTKLPLLSVKNLNCEEPKNKQRCKQITDTGIINLYYGSLHRVSIRERAQYTIESLLSNIGGIMGLLTGFSVITFVEFGFLFCDLCRFIVRKIAVGLING